MRRLSIDPSEGIKSQQARQKSLGIDPEQRVSLILALGTTNTSSLNEIFVNELSIRFDCCHYRSHLTGCV